MVIKVGVNGFGRVGRIVFRTSFQHPDLEITAINDPAVDIEYICYLIKFDSTHGKLKAEVTHKGNEIQIDDRTIKVFHHKVPASIPWRSAGVEYVVEASGMFSSQEKAAGHLTTDGVKRVIVTAPSVDIPMIVLGVNDDVITSEMKVLSCGSSTLYCLAPIMKLLVEAGGLEAGFVTSIHAMTPSLKPLDGLCLRGKHWREHRSITQNIIPATTGACKALGKIVPQVKDKMTGIAFRVPIANVSLLDITVRLTTNTTLEAIVQSAVKASKTKMKNIITTAQEENVSSDFIGDIHSCILDVTSSLQIQPNFIKLVCWYENEYSYACRVVDTILFSEKQFNQVESTTKTTYVRPRLSTKQDMLQQTDFCIKETTIDSNCNYAKIEQSNDKKILLTSNVFSGALSQIYPLEIPTVVKKEEIKNNILDDSARSSNNDTNDKSVNDNIQRTIFFPKPVSPKSSKTVDCSKAQERLEKVKREFYKMVDMTEDLLKISNNSKYNLEVGNRDNYKKEFVSSNKLSKCNEKANNDVQEMSPDKMHHNDKIDQIKRTFDPSSDSKSNVTTHSKTSHTKNNLSKEDMVRTISYGRESNYSVNEIKKFFENSQYFLEMRGQNKNVSAGKESQKSSDNNDTQDSSEISSVDLAKLDKLEHGLLSSEGQLESRLKNFISFEKNNAKKPLQPSKPSNIDKHEGNDQVTKTIVPQRLNENSVQKDNFLNEDAVEKDLSKNQGPTKSLPKAKDTVHVWNVQKIPALSECKTQEGIHIPTFRSTECKKDSFSLEGTDWSKSPAPCEVEPKSPNTLIENPSRQFSVGKMRESKNTSPIASKQILNQQLEHEDPTKPSLSQTRTVESTKRDEGIPINKNFKNHVSKTFCSILDGLSKNFQFQSYPGKDKHAGMTHDDKPHDVVSKKSDTATSSTKNINTVLDSLKRFQFVKNPSKDNDSGAVNKIPDIKFQNAIARGGDNAVIVDIDLRKHNHTLVDATSPNSHIVDLEKKRKRNIGNYPEMKTISMSDKRGDRKSRSSIVSDIISEVPNEEDDMSHVSQTNEACIKGNAQSAPVTSNSTKEIAPNGIKNNSYECVIQRNVKIDLQRDVKEEVDHPYAVLNRKSFPRTGIEETTDLAAQNTRTNAKYISTKLNLNKPRAESEKSLDISSHSLETLTVIDEELKKRNIELMNFTENPKEGNLETESEKDKLVGRYLDDVDSYNRCIVGVERTTSSRCSSPLSAYAERSYKQDIYDKLDSASASDSQNSLDIDRKKSQIISIKDLTSSIETMEDLERLDKICRIIEISDELSDKLFSVLDSEAEPESNTNKKWSFKDLCEKIKLDEFCNNVFGK